MRVTIPALALELGGGTRSLVRIATGLSQRGHQVCFVIPEGAPVQWEVPVPIRWVPELTPDVFPPADVILPNFWRTVQPAWQSGQGRVIRLCQGYEPLWITDPAARATYDLPVPVIAISHWVADRVQAQTGRAARVIPLGVDPTVMHPPTAPTARRGLLYIWRHKAHGYAFKGSDDFAAALGQVLKRYPQLPITVVATERLPIALPCAYTPVFAPTDADLAALYRQAALFVSTSWFEAFSLAPLEAMACGAAVVSTDCGGIREYARQGDNCLLVPPQDPSQLAEAIGQVLADPALAAALGERGAITGREWTWERTCDAMDEALRQIVDGS